MKRRTFLQSMAAGLASLATGRLPAASSGFRITEPVRNPALDPIIFDDALITTPLLHGELFIYAGAAPFNPGVVADASKCLGVISFKGVP
jgi:hypothetical protein